MDARVPFSEVQETFGIEAPDGGDEFDTLGGFVTHELGRLPKAGETVKRDGVTVVVESVEGRRVGRVRVIREPIPTEQRPGRCRLATRISSAARRSRVSARTRRIRRTKSPRRSGRSAP